VKIGEEPPVRPLFDPTGGTLIIRVKTVTLPRDFEFEAHPFKFLKGSAARACRPRPAQKKIKKSKVVD
jgi:hypothetical protein